MFYSTNKEITSEMLTCLAEDKYTKTESRKDIDYLSFLTYMITLPEEKKED